MYHAHPEIANNINHSTKLRRRIEDMNTVNKESGMRGDE